MFRTLRRTRIAWASPVPARLIAAALALILVGLLAQSASALSDDYVDAKTKQRAKNCQNDGGIAKHHYEYNADGSVSSVSTTCVGTPGGNDWNCYSWDGGKDNCVAGAMRPTQTRLPQQQLEVMSPQWESLQLAEPDANAPLLVPADAVEP